MEKPDKQHERGGRRRVFSAEFELEAVRRMRERRATARVFARSGRKLGVRPDLLRAWATQADERAGAVPRDVFPGHGQLPTEQEELRRLQRENALLVQETDDS